MEDADTITKETAAEELASIIADLRLIAGRSGTVEFLERLRSVHVYGLQPVIDQPQPMFFDDAWGEVIDALLLEARR
jgi:hypothetical protein